METAYNKILKDEKLKETLNILIDKKNYSDLMIEAISFGLLNIKIDKLKEIINKNISSFETLEEIINYMGVKHE